MDNAYPHLHASFARQSFLELLGARLVTLEPGRCAMAMPLGPQMRQQQGAGHAGVTFTLGDSAAGYAALTTLDPEMDVLTSELKIHLLRPAFGARLVATGTVVKPGRRLVVVQADVHSVADDGAEVLIARLLGTMVPVKPEL